jgi:hypothetical protein
MLLLETQTKKDYKEELLEALKCIDNILNDKEMVD